MSTGSTIAKRLIWLSAMAAIALCACPAGSIAAGKDSGDAARHRARQIEQLVDLTNLLERRVQALERRAAGLQAVAQPAALAPAPVTTKEAAGGDLTGFYPSPLLAPNSVGTAEIADQGVGTLDIAGGLQHADIGLNTLHSEDVHDFSLSDGILSDKIGAAHLAPIVTLAFTSEQHTFKPGDASRIIRASCQTGTRLLTGAWRWTNLNGAGTNIVESHPAEAVGFDPEKWWEFRVFVASGGTENTFIPEAQCLLP